MRFVLLFFAFLACFGETIDTKNPVDSADSTTITPQIPIRQEFLTPYEYGRALYANPRGIGCIECHGDSGEGALIGEYRQNGKLKRVFAPKIRGVKFARFESALKNPKGLMPRYNLTSSELLALYTFLNPGFKPPR